MVTSGGHHSQTIALAEIEIYRPEGPLKNKVMVAT
jgi:hypothetical protein